MSSKPKQIVDGIIGFCNSPTTATNLKISYLTEVTNTHFLLITFYINEEEIIITDNYSTDRSYEVCEDYIFQVFLELLTKSVDFNLEKVL